MNWTASFQTFSFNGWSCQACQMVLWAACSVSWLSVCRWHCRCLSSFLGLSTQCVSRRAFPPLYLHMALHAYRLFFTLALSTLQVGRLLKFLHLINKQCVPTDILKLGYRTISKCHHFVVGSCFWPQRNVFSEVWKRKLTSNKMTAFYLYL